MTSVNLPKLQMDAMFGMVRLFKMGAGVCYDFYHRRAGVHCRGFHNRAGVWLPVVLFRSPSMFGMAVPAIGKSSSANSMSRLG